jgi:hypothetical protein
MSRHGTSTAACDTLEIGTAVGAAVGATTADGALDVLGASLLDGFGVAGGAVTFEAVEVVVVGEASLVSATLEVSVLISVALVDDDETDGLKVATSKVGRGKADKDAVSSVEVGLAIAARIKSMATTAPQRNAHSIDATQTQN